MTKSLFETTGALDPLATAEAFKRASGSCEQCGGPGPLESHLIRLFQQTEDGPEPILGSATAADLRVLCRPCHDQAHRDPAGEYWTDPEAMAAEWESYHEELEKP